VGYRASDVVLNQLNVKADTGIETGDRRMQLIQILGSRFAVASLLVVEGVAYPISY